MPVFVDTNIWVSTADGADLVKQARAAALLAMHGPDIVVSTRQWASSTSHSPGSSGKR